MSQRKLKTSSDLEMEDTIAHYRDTRKNQVFCSLIEGDLDHHETEIDFGSGMKLSVTRVYRQE